MHHAATRHIVRGTSLMTTRITHHLRLFATTKGQPTQLHDAVSTTPMTWPDFFATRRRLQLLKRFAGIPFVVGFWAAEGFILSLPIFDPTKTILDVDPMVLVGLATIGGTLASYFVGASCTGWLWRVFKRDTAMLLDLKQRDFYSRISKHRANVPPNPTQMNFNFDYYGEKIHSMSDYKSWLRRQRQLLAARVFPLK